jgi:C4-dicarboxylate-specific signal transduction histidine kinase
VPLSPPRTESALASDLALRHEIFIATQPVVLGEVARLIGHEINQPLAAVSANAAAALRWLQRDPPDSAEAQAALQRILADSRRAAELLRGIQAFLGRALAPRTQVAIDALLDEVQAACASLAAASDVNLTVDGPRDPALVVFGNHGQLVHMLASLVTNACESLQRVPPPRHARLAAARKGTDVAIEVTDNGPGLGESGRERHFEPFYTTKPDGLGLGLAVSRMIVESHGGHLRAAPNTGEGETFCVTLPLYGP